MTDTKAVETVEGWLYLAVILDLFSRLVVGWAMAATEDEQLVELALRMAVAQRHPPTGLLHHSDRGSEFTSDRYLALLAELGIQVSMSRTANCYDNAAMESFFASLTKECTDRTRFKTRQEARSAIFEYLECFYNPVRLHSTLQYVSPLAFEQATESKMSYYPTLESPSFRVNSRFYQAIDRDVIRDIIVKDLFPRTWSYSYDQPAPGNREFIESILPDGSYFGIGTVRRLGLRTLNLRDMTTKSLQY